METNTTQSSLNTTAADDINNYIEQHIATQLYKIYQPICACFGVLGNGISFSVLVMTSMRSTTTCRYMAAIALMDSMILIMAMAFYIDNHIYNYLTEGWSCGLIRFFFYTTIHYDVLLVVAMTVERYLVVKFPLHASTLVTIKKATLVITSIGLFSVAVNMHNIFTRSAEWNGFRYICTVEGAVNVFFVYKVYSGIDSTLYCFIPMTSLIIFNALIIWNLKYASQNQHLMRYGSRGEGQGQVTRMLLLVSMTFLILSLPMGLVLIVERYGWVRETIHDEAIYNLARRIIDNLMFTNHTVNFLLYCVSGRKFRENLRQLCCRKDGASKEVVISIVPSNKDRVDMSASTETMTMEG